MGSRLALIAILLSTALLSPFSTAHAGGIPDYRFGVVEAYEAPGAASALGAGWTRVTFRWNEIQPNGPNEWNVGPISDQALNTELVQGRQVIGLLVTTPGWATDVGIGPGVPKGLYLPTDDPGNLWANFVRSMVSRYAGRIDHWIIWNEPDIPDTRHMSWGGSTEDFVRLLQVAYAVSKETNPNAVIHMAAVTHWWNEHWFGNFLDALIDTPGAAESNYFFDVATLHIYFQPETVYDITAHYRSMMHGHNIHKPIWIAETNAAPSQDPAWPVPNPQFNISLDEQAAFIIQAFSLGIAAGAERIAVYKMADTETDRAANPEPFGLVRMDGSRRPAFTAYQVAANYLAGFRGGRWDRRDELSVVTVDRGAKTTTVAWSRVPEPQTAAIAARTTRALLVDARGSTRYVYPDHGYYFVDLPGANCTQGCLIGGAPMMLIEEAPLNADTAPPPASLTPPPVENENENKSSDTAANTDAMPTPTPTFTPTPTPTPSPTPTASPTPTVTPTAAATATPTPTSTPTPAATPLPTLTPSPTPISVPMSEVPLGRPWSLVGVLAIAIGSAALAVERRERRTPALWLRAIRRPPGRRTFVPKHVGGFLLLIALMISLLLISRGLFL